MDSNTDMNRFREADSLFRQGRYQDALNLLDSLNRAYPNTQNILYPAALCLQRLGHHEQARAVCEQLITQFGDARARQLGQQLATAVALPGAGGTLSALDDLLGPSASPPPLPIRKESNSKLYSTFAVIAACTVGGVLMAAYANSYLAADAAPTGAIVAIWFAGYMLLGILCGLLGAWSGLKIIGKLRFDVLEEDIGDIAWSVVMCTLLSATCIGVFAIPYYLKKKYDTTIGELFILIIVYSAFSFGANLVLHGITVLVTQTIFGAMDVNTASPGTP